MKNLHEWVAVVSFVCVCSVVQSCQTLRDPLDCSPPVSSAHGIFLATVVEWVDISSSRGSSWPRNPAGTSCLSCRMCHVLFESLGCCKFLAGSSQECHSVGNLHCQLKWHPYALYVWHAGKRPGIIIGKFKTWLILWSWQRTIQLLFGGGLPGCQRVELFFPKKYFWICSGVWLKWRRKWQPTPVFLPGKSLGQRSLAGHSPWGQESQIRLSN